MDNQEKGITETRPSLLCLFSTEPPDDSTPRALIRLPILGDPHLNCWTHHCCWLKDLKVTLLAWWKVKSKASMALVHQALSIPKNDTKCGVHHFPSFSHGFCSIFSRVKTAPPPVQGTLELGPTAWSTSCLSSGVMGLPQKILQNSLGFSHGKKKHMKHVYEIVL